MVNSILGYICYALFALVIVMIVNFIIARLMTGIEPVRDKELVDNMVGYCSVDNVQVSANRTIVREMDKHYF